MIRLWSIMLSVGSLVAVNGCGQRAAPVAAVASALEDDTEGALDAPPVSFAIEVAPVFTKYCLSCHSQETARGEVVLEGLGNGPAAPHLDLVQKVTKALRIGRMPPPGKPRPTQEEQALVHAWLDAVTSQASCEPTSTARMLVRRLNRAEYDNTVRDLTGLDLGLARDFPADDVGYGFDNIGEVLSISPLLAERYVTAAETIVDRLFAEPGARARLFNLPAQDRMPYGLRGLLPVRDEPQKVLRLSSADLPAADAVQPELDRAGNLIREFADRAFRRPITYQELNRLLRFVETSHVAGEGTERGLRLALEAILTSPYFLFRIDHPPRAESVPVAHDFELATRLSYFLWSSMPDEELYRLAAAGELRQSSVLRAQTRRMLQDPRARALVDNFAMQWLQLRNLRDFAPDPAQFPEFDEPLRAAMRTETELFLKHILHEDRSVLEIIDAEYTFVNQRLARHYGMVGVYGNAFRQVSLAGTPRGGILTQASVLAVTSNPTRTSLVKRGKWILENVLGTPLPPPPPGFDNLTAADPLAGTLRQRLERHRRDPQCASCHEMMDPLGFGLESFDAIGTWRTHDQGDPIDDSGTFVGQPFQGPAQLRTLLLSHRDDFARCLSEKALTYALGRGLTPCDRPAVNAIARRLVKNGYRFSSLIVGVVLSESFRISPQEAVRRKP
jgi:mono/diheme cytochrome c family protein